MQLTQRSLEKFKQLYLKVFSEELSDDEVRRKAEYLVELCRTVYGMPDLAEYFDNKINSK